MSDVLKRVRNAPEMKLWIPGQGEIDPRLSAAQRVVREYDERLVLARHEVTGDWVIFIKIDREWMYPVIGLGPELPENAEDLRQRMWKADAAVHGDKILRDINAHNERILKEKRDAANEAAEEVAEAFVWGFRQEGVLPKQVFVPRDL